MHILYVCTWNIFRSMSAEYLTRKYLDDHHITTISVSSAWTVAHPEPPFETTVTKLLSYGCDPSPHIQRKISPEILAEQDLIICMAEHHRQAVRDLGFDAVLFNEIAYGKSEDLMDDTEYGEAVGNFDLEPFIIHTVEYIHEAIPIIIEKIEWELA